MAKKTGVTLESWLAEAHRLRSTMFEAEVEFYLWLVDGEAQLQNLWAKYGSFGELLEAESLSDVVRYQSFRDGLRVVSRAEAKVIGVSGVCQSAKIKDATKRATAIQAQIAWRQEHDHTPSPRTVSGIIQSVAPVPRLPKALKSALSREKLEEENRLLKEKVRVLEKENRELRISLKKKQAA